MRRGLIVCLLVACGGCGSSAKPAAPAEPRPSDSALAAAEARRKEIAAMKPASPFEVRDRAIYRPPERCGQGPYRFEIDALRARYGERLFVYACGAHFIAGNYRLRTTRASGAETVGEHAFGFDADNAACKAREGMTAAASGGGGGRGGAGRPSRGGGGATSAAPATIQPLAIERATRIPADCVRTQVIDYSWTSSEDHVALDGRLVLDVWSDVPNDLAGLVFVIERSAVAADMTRERWQAYQAASDAYYRAYKANLDRELAAGHSRLVDNAVKTPPPPPPRAESRPPRPSRNARWIPGYWHYEATRFHWIAGLWDVPDDDLRRELTVQAPTPPPATPARDEPVEPAPTRTAVWAPGSWQWDGRAYVWVAGAWRIPPDPRATWQRATWTVRGGRATFVPGGWRARVRLGR